MCSIFDIICFTSSIASHPANICILTEGMDLCFNHTCSSRLSFLKHTALVRTCHFPIVSAEPLYQYVRIDPGIIFVFLCKRKKTLVNHKSNLGARRLLSFSFYRYICQTYRGQRLPPPSPHGGGCGGPALCGRLKPLGGRPRAPQQRRWFAINVIGSSNSNRA